MLDRVKIQNFQSLHNVELDLAKFTTIVGETDSGKSAFVRALRGLVENISAKGVVFFGETNFKVEVNTGESVVTWVKGKDNRYSVVTGNCDKQELDRVGASCPSVVLDILRMGKISVDDTISFLPNFHSQFDMPFLMGETPSYVSKVLGQLTNINLLLAAAKVAKAQISLWDSEERNQSALICNIDNELEQLSDIQVMRGVVDKASGIKKKVEELKVDLDASEKYQSNLEIKINQFTECHAQEQLLAEFVPGLDSVVESVLEKLTAKRDSEGVLIKIKGLRVRVEALTEELKKLKFVDRLSESISVFDLRVREFENFCSLLESVGALESRQKAAEDVCFSFRGVLPALGFIVVQEQSVLTYVEIKEKAALIERMDSMRLSEEDILRVLIEERRIVKAALEQIDCCPLCGSSLEHE